MMFDGGDALSDLEVAERVALERLLEPCEFEPGETLFVQGAPADGVHFVRRGRISIRVRLPGGELSEIALLGAGEILGELLLGGSPRTATAVAVDQVGTGFMRREEFLMLYESYHPLSFKLLHRLARSIALRIASTSAALGPGPGLNQAIDALGPVSLRSGAFFDPRPFLPKLPFFQGFSARDIDELLEQATLCQAPRGCVLFRESDPGDAVYIIVRGAVEVLSGTGSVLGRIALRGPGAVVGDMAVLLDTPRNASCRVREDAVLLRLSRAATQSLLDPTRKLSFKFLRAILVNLTTSIERTNRTLAGRERARRSERPESRES